MVRPQPRICLGRLVGSRTQRRRIRLRLKLFKLDGGGDLLRNCSSSAAASSIRHHSGTATRRGGHMAARGNRLRRSSCSSDAYARGQDISELLSP